MNRSEIRKEFFFGSKQVFGSSDHQMVCVLKKMCLNGVRTIISRTDMFGLVHFIQVHLFIRASLKMSEIKSKSIFDKKNKSDEIGRKFLGKFPTKFKKKYIRN